jgi:hypothetical protein
MTLFFTQKKIQKSIHKEINRIEHQDQIILNALHPDAYARWYLPIRKLVSDLPTIAQYQPEKIPVIIEALRNLNLRDIRLYKSGLYKEVIEKHIVLIENNGKPQDSLFAEMKLSIDRMMKPLLQDEKKLNEVTDFLFDLLETRSLFPASEYLALKMLNQTGCTLHSDLSRQLEPSEP